MGRALTLTALLALSAATPAPSAIDGSRVLPVKAFLCDSAAHAIAFADVMATGEIEEIAQDRVGRAAKAEVCGRYVGMAVVESEQIKLAGGMAYKLTAYRFQEDHRVAWLAERTFAPTHSNWDL